MNEIATISRTAHIVDAIEQPERCPTPLSAASVFTQRRSGAAAAA